MFGLDPALTAFIVLAALSAGALAYGFMFNTVANERKAEKRLKSVKNAETDRALVRATRDRMAEAARRKKSIQDSLKELEQKQKARNRDARRPPLKMQLRQAGVGLGVRQFYIASAICGVTVTLILYLIGAPTLALPGALLAGSLGLPHWLLALLRRRRVQAFLDEFPNALDVIVRSVRSGLPLNDGIRIIASESREPVRAEFRRIVESQQLGLSTPDAVMRMSETMPCPEAGFFGIVVQIQSQAGGSLSEALSNLAGVLRDRKKMKAKVQALSMEAKASAAIIGALPFIVAFLVYLSSPTYIMPLFTTSIGQLIIGASAVWMLIGILVMHKMMNFEI